MPYLPVATQNPEATRAAIAIFQNGTSPTPDPWHGGKPKLSVDYTSITVPVHKTAENMDGSTTFACLVHFGTSMGGGSGGFYSNSMLFQRFLKTYPDGLGALQAQFKNALNYNLFELQDGIRNWLNERPAQVLDALLGRETCAEWEGYDTLKVGMDSLTPIGDVQFRGGLRQPFSIKVAIKARKRQAITGLGPFSKMSDRELDAMLARYEQRAPENFWMDGELQMSRPAALKMYRDQYRALSPRAQQRLFAQLSTY